jgi:hypothetical protein
VFVAYSVYYSGIWPKELRINTPDVVTGIATEIRIEDLANASRERTFREIRVSVFITAPPHLAFSK